MRVAILITTILLIFSSSVLADPTKKEARAMIKEIKTALKASDQVLASGKLQQLHDHSRWFNDIGRRAQQVFVPFIKYGACSGAANNAGQIWRSKLDYSQRPNKMAFDSMERSTKYYLEDMEQCGEAIAKMK